MKLEFPENAKLAFKGKIFEVWQWEQEMYDGKKGIFERISRPDTVQVIAIQDEKIILTKEKQPDSETLYTGFPGGRVEENEEPISAAQRELMEETGCESLDWQLLYAEQPVRKMRWTVYTYVARNCKKKNEQALDNGEKIEIHPISFDDFLMLSEEPLFRSGGLSLMLMRARFDPAYKEELRVQLFGKKN